MILCLSAGDYFSGLNNTDKPQVVTIETRSGNFWLVGWLFNRSQTILYTLPAEYTSFNGTWFPYVITDCLRVDFFFSVTLNSWYSVFSYLWIWTFNRYPFAYSMFEVKDVLSSVACKMKLWSQKKWWGTFIGRRDSRETYLDGRKGMLLCWEKWLGLYCHALIFTCTWILSSFSAKREFMQYYTPPMCITTPLVAFLCVLPKKVELLEIRWGSECNI